jgi:hypothetical protein
MSEESKFSTCRNHSAACSRASLGIRPTISLETGTHAVARGFALHEFEDAVDRRLLEVGQVHGDLGHAAHQEARALDVAQAAGGEAHGLGDLFGDGHVGGVQENVVGDQRLARADDGGSGGGMHARLAEVGLAGRVGGDLVADALELAAADVFQILPLGRGGGGFVEIDRNLEAAGDFRADVRAMATQSSRVTPSMGMKGMTSAAPMRGCAPW